MSMIFYVFLSYWGILPFYFDGLKKIIPLSFLLGLYCLWYAITPITLNIIYHKTTHDIQQIVLIFLCIYLVEFSFIGLALKVETTKK